MNPNILKRSQMTQDRHRKLETQNQIGAVTRPMIQDLGSRSLMCFSIKFVNILNKNILSFLLRCLKNTPTLAIIWNFPWRFPANPITFCENLGDYKVITDFKNIQTNISQHPYMDVPDVEFTELLHNCSTFYKFWVGSGTYVWQC